MNFIDYVSQLSEAVDTIKYYVGSATGLNFDKISYTDETKEYFKAADLKKGLKNCRTKDDVVKLLNTITKRPRYIPNLTWVYEKDIKDDKTGQTFWVFRIAENSGAIWLCLDYKFDEMIGIKELCPPGTILASKTGGSWFFFRVKSYGKADATVEELGNKYAQGKAPKNGSYVFPDEKSVLSVEKVKIKDSEAYSKKNSCFITFNEYSKYSDDKSYITYDF